MKKFFLAIAKFFNLFPCPLCRIGNGNGQNDLCDQCLASLEFIAIENHCRGCGGVLDGALAVCSKCQKEKKRPWLDAVSLFHYRGSGRELILKFKSGSSPEIARPLGKLGAQAIEKSGFRFDAIVPIPLSFRSQWKRSYNQSLLVAQQISAQLGIPVIEALKCRIRHRKQAMLNRRERWKNSGDRFLAVKPELFAGKRLLIVDDIFTTGSTCTAAAKVLLKSGSREIYVFTCARTPGAADAK